jgi:hypothetical protein
MYMLTFYLTVFLAYTLTFYWHSFWQLFWHSFWHGMVSGICSAILFVRVQAHSTASGLDLRKMIKDEMLPKWEGSPLHTFHTFHSWIVRLTPHSTFYTSHFTLHTLPPQSTPNRLQWMARFQLMCIGARGLDQVFSWLFHKVFSKKQMCVDHEAWDWNWVEITLESSPASSWCATWLSQRKWWWQKNVALSSIRDCKGFGQLNMCSGPGHVWAFLTPLRLARKRISFERVGSIGPIFL